MQYKVPQNIDQEDKILGPLTFTQFIYMLVGGGILLLEFSLLDLSLFLLFGLPTLILTVCFSLIKVQDQPFSRFFISLLLYAKQPKHRIWLDQERPTDSQHGLGGDFLADVQHDQPAPASLANPTVTPVAAAPTLAKVLTIQSDTGPPSITPQITSSDSQAGFKPPRRLQVAIVKGGS